MPKYKAIIFDPVECIKGFSDELWSEAPTFKMLGNARWGDGHKFDGRFWEAGQLMPPTARAPGVINTLVSTHYLRAGFSPPEVIQDFPEYAEFWEKCCFVEPEKYYKQIDINTGEPLHDWVEIKLGKYLLWKEMDIHSAPPKKMRIYQYTFWHNVPLAVYRDGTNRKLSPDAPRPDDKEYRLYQNYLIEETVKLEKLWNRLRRAARNRTGVDAEEQKKRKEKKITKAARVTAAKMDFLHQLDKFDETMAKYKQTLIDGKKLRFEDWEEAMLAMRRLQENSNNLKNTASLRRKY